MENFIGFMANRQRGGEKENFYGKNYKFYGQTTKK